MGAEYAQPDYAVILMMCFNGINLPLEEINNEYLVFLCPNVTAIGNECINCITTMELNILTYQN